MDDAEGAYGATAPLWSMAAGPRGPWHGGAATARRHGGHQVWHPGEGGLSIQARDGVETLQLEDTDLTLADIAAAISADPTGQEPRLVPGEILVAGVIGRLVLGREVIRFRGVQRIVIGGYSAYRR